MNITDDLSKAGVAQPHIVHIEVILCAHVIRDRSSAAVLYQTGEPRLFIAEGLRDIVLRAAHVGHNRVRLQSAAHDLPASAIRTALLSELEQVEDMAANGDRVATTRWLEKMAAKHREYVEKIQAVA